MKCPVCGYKDSPCGNRDSKRNDFHIRLRSNFQDHMTVPCFAKRKFDAITDSEVIVKTLHKEVYEFNLEKSSKRTRISGGHYNMFLENYNMKHGDQVLLVMDYKHPYFSMYPLDKIGHIKERVLEEYVFKNTARTVVFSKDMEPTPTEIGRINRCVRKRGIGLSAVFVHIITSSDIDKNLLHIPKFIASDLDIPCSGNALLVGANPHEHTTASYYTSTDRRFRFKTGWTSFAANNNLAAGKGVLIMFHKNKREVRISFDVVRFYLSACFYRSN